MSLSVLTVPQFRKGQAVRFTGGVGTIKNYQSESGTWMYLLQMELGPEPDFGRVGAETMLWLPEVDLLALEERSFRELTIPLNCSIYDKTA
jgi:hypothetical protein